MSKTRLLTLIFFTVLLTGCKVNNTQKASENCLAYRIKLFEESAPCPKGLNVSEYTFQNQIVYVLGGKNCGADMTTEVINTDCNTIGYLGGITGNTKINKENFSNAVFNRIVWKN